MTVQFLCVYLTLACLCISIHCLYWLLVSMSLVTSIFAECLDSPGFVWLVGIGLNKLRQYGKSCAKMNQHARISIIQAPFYKTLQSLYSLHLTTITPSVKRMMLLFAQHSKQTKRRVYPAFLFWKTRRSVISTKHP